ncbi:FG-GAP repeat domain-containing protein (plasmid) [Pseudoalteromonas sp. T1lg65]|uniref:FG-GAP repeat domain-containing protein n=1 Tax=Pseudoalteromonas sp. T1lg65 TaxID=2077101 RepID=UPI003F796F36
MNDKKNSTLIKPLVIAMLSALPIGSAMASLDLKLVGSSGLYTTDGPIAFTAHAKNKQLEVIDLKNMTSEEIKLPDNALGFDYGSFTKTDKTQAVVLAADGVYLVSSQTPKKLVAINSIFNLVKSENFKKLDFVADVNQDGLSDLFLPGIEQSTLAIQNSQGGFDLHRFDYPLSITFSDKNSLKFKLPNLPISFDLNRDGFNDVLIKTKTSIDVLYGSQSGYADSISPLSFAWDNIDRQSIETIADINNDGYLDMISKTVSDSEEEKGLNTTAEHKLHLGSKSGIDAEGTKLLTASAHAVVNVTEDYNGDGLADLMAGTMDFGIGALTSAVFGDGKIEMDIEIDIYQQLSNGQFQEKPNRSEEIEVAFDRNNKGGTDPSFSSDINGDGKQDLVYKSGSKTLTVYYGNSDTLLDKRRTKIKYKLPELTNDIRFVDINGDGKDDFVFRFKDEDGKVRIETKLN